MRSSRAALMTVSLLVARIALGQNYFNPGTMGPNALPPLRCESPWVGEGWVAELGLAGQISAPPLRGPDDPLLLELGSGPSTNQSFTVPFHAEYRIVRRAALMVEGSPVELWLVSAGTQQKWGTPNAYGLAKADLRIGGKFLFFEGRGWLPAITFRAWTKTTTGKSAADHRFIDAPGYQFDLILGEHFDVTPSFALELWAAGGFLAWQQKQYGQNDAPAWSVMVSGLWAGGTALRLHYEGYRGWQKDDKPQAFGLQLELPVKQEGDSQPAVSAFAGITYSFLDPEYGSLNIGIRVGSVAQGRR